MTECKRAVLPRVGRTSSFVFSELRWAKQAARGEKQRVDLLRARPGSGGSVTRAKRKKCESLTGKRAEVRVEERFFEAESEPNAYFRCADQRQRHLLWRGRYPIELAQVRAARYVGFGQHRNHYPRLDRASRIVVCFALSESAESDVRMGFEPGGLGAGGAGVVLYRTYDFSTVQTANGSKRIVGAAD